MRQGKSERKEERGEKVLEEGKLAGAYALKERSGKIGLRGCRTGQRIKDRG